MGKTCLGIFQGCLRHPVWFLCFLEEMLRFEKAQKAPGNWVKSLGSHGNRLQGKGVPQVEREWMRESYACEYPGCLLGILRGLWAHHGLPHGVQTARGSLSVQEG